ncbi:MAG: phosphoribosylformylglycinamidine cyclo-ligase [Candidatus Aenigmarchaeota archaeon]|nr:phosphoribosylformylglycinamidine cyclo-ligase [Candidatus Aenigmarchaeota archaeon]
MTEEFTYAKAGVDVSKEKNAYKRIGEILRETLALRKGKFGEVLSDIGHYAGLVDIGGGRALAVHADGVGTKIMVAEFMNKFDTIGIDCIAMNVNDLICMGAEPVLIVDYLAIEKLDDRIIEEIAKGLADGAKQSDVAIVGGETALMPDMIKGSDLSAMSMGVVEKDKVITGGSICVGDIVIGLESSGLHSNGLTLARKLLLGSFNINDAPPELNGRTVGQELLEPTKIYVKPVMEMVRSCEVHGLANITGGAFSKLMRLGDIAGIGFDLYSMPEPHPVFKLMQKIGNVSEREMHRTFNMGVGFCVIADKKEYGKIEDICKKYGIKCWIIGKAISEKKVFVRGTEVG